MMRRLAWRRGAFVVAAAAIGGLSVSIAGAESFDPVDPATEFRRPLEIGAMQIPNSQSAAHVPSAFVPRPEALPISGAAGLGVSVEGLNFMDQRLADSGNQFSLEPPDPALCVGNGFVVETDNDVVRVRSAVTGAVTATGGTRSLNKFFIGDSAIIRTPTPAVFGTFVTDPKCVYDPELQRFFFTVLTLDRTPEGGAFTGGTDVRLAVSKTSTPSTAPADWHIYSFPTENDGTSNQPDHAGCPCFGDQPLIGFDDHGFYVSTNEFSIAPFGAVFNGAQIYAIDKVEAAAGTLNAMVNGPDIQLIDGTPIPLAEGPAYSLQPATVPPGGSFEGAAGGSEYFLSALDFDATLDNRIAVWALTNTSSLGTDSPDVELGEPFILASEVYGQPPDASQRMGPTPLADVARSLFAPKPGNGPDEHLNLLAGNDDRMQQTVFADGKLWSSLNTVAKTGNGPTRVGAAYFIVDPAVSSDGDVTATMVNQGYVAALNQGVLFPAVGVNSDGEGAMVFTLAGPGFFPSAAYTTIDAGGAGSTIRVAAAGAVPADGFSGYRVFGSSGTERWGDYHTAFADESGKIWMNVEYISGTVPLVASGTLMLGNWSTRVFQFTP